MNILEYVPSYNDVRAVIGVGPKELADKVLGLDTYYVQLENALDDFHVDLTTVFEELKAKKKAHEDDSSKPALTKLERRILGTTQVYSVYTTALILMSSLPIFAVKSLTDGKAEFVRVNDPFKNVKEALQIQQQALGDELLDLLEQNGAVITPDTFYFPLGVSDLAEDPVTGA